MARHPRTGHHLVSELVRLPLKPTSRRYPTSSHPPSDLLPVRLGPVPTSLCACAMWSRSHCQRSPDFDPLHEKPGTRTLEHVALTGSQMRAEAECRKNRSLRQRSSSRFPSETAVGPSCRAMLSHRSSTSWMRSARPSLKSAANSAFMPARHLLLADVEQSFVSVREHDCSFSPTRSVTSQGPFHSFLTALGKCRSLVHGLKKVISCQGFVSL